MSANPSSEKIGSIKKYSLRLHNKRTKNAVEGNKDRSNGLETRKLELSLSTATPNITEVNTTRSPETSNWRHNRHRGWNRIRISSSDNNSDNESTSSQQLQDEAAELTRSPAATTNIRKGSQRPTSMGSFRIADTEVHEEIPSTSATTSVNVSEYASPEILDRINNFALMDGKYFELCGKVKDTDSIPVACKNCPNKKVLIGSFKTTSNLLKHLRKVHPTIHEEYLDYKKSKRSENSKRDCSTDRNEPPKKRQKKSRAQVHDQADFENKLLRFVIETMTPLSTIDHPSFKKLFEGDDEKLVSRRTITRRLIEMDAKRLEKTKDLLSQAKYVCTTADIWSARRRSFIGVTGHFIKDDFTRESLPLACRRFKGTHSYENIASILENIHSMYGLTVSKIVATVTDNATNFVKAFKEFGIELNEKREQASYDDDASEDSDMDCSSSSSDIETSEEMIFLPHHLRCSTHTLHLVATSDLTNALKKDDHMFRRHSNTIAKCSKLWHKAALPKSAEIIKGTVGHTFSYPIVTRWNSLYDALRQILKSKAALPSLFERLELGETFTTSEITYMEDYCEVMQPMVRATDILQGQDKIYYGMLLSTLITLKRKLESLAASRLRCGRVLAKACLDGLYKRFDNFLSFDDRATDVIVAAISHPAFKLQWFSAVNKTYKLELPLSDMNEMFVNASRSFREQNYSNNSNERCSGSVSSFLAVGCSGSQSYNSDSDTSQSNEKGFSVDDLRVQLMSFLNDKRTRLTILNEYPIIREIFLKYNTPLASSAPVERLFSFATIVNAPRRHALCDTNFERIVLLKSFAKYNTMLA